MTTPSDIRAWLYEGGTQGATHVLVVCDTFDHSDYPVFVVPGEDPRVIATMHTRDLSRVMECYALHLDFETQLSEQCASHYESPSKHDIRAGAPIVLGTNWYESMARGTAVHAAVEAYMKRPRTLYDKLLALTNKTHEQAQAALQAEREERARLAAHEATRPKTPLDEDLATHFFIEALIDLCEKHNRSIDPFAAPESKGPYR